MKNLRKKSIFSKITKIINGNIGSVLRKAKDEYKYSKCYTGRDHILSMLFLQLSESSGLRDLTCRYKNSSVLSKEFAIPSYSELSRLNKNKDASIFRDLYLNVLDMAKRELPSKSTLKEFDDIEVIDSSVVCLGKGLAPELYFRENKSAIRISTLLSNNLMLPLKVTIAPGKVGERKCIVDYISDKKRLYLFDKGYAKYSWFDKLNDDQMKFVTRMCSNAATEEYISTDTGIDNLYDYIISIGSDAAKNKTRYKYREILYFENDSDDEFRLVTNVFDLPAQDIVSLYKKRWSIELFFKWIKQHLTIKKLVGRTLNSISIQIYSALIVYILLLLIKKRLELNGTLYDTLRKIQSYLLATSSLKNIFT